MERHPFFARLDSFGYCRRAVLNRCPFWRQWTIDYCSSFVASHLGYRNSLPNYPCLRWYTQISHLCLWKEKRCFGGVRVGLQPTTRYSVEGGIGVPDTAWTFYSSVDTITAVSGDSIIVAISTGACEICLGTTYLNTCKLEKLD